MDEFEKLLALERCAVERFVRFRLPSREDAEDVLQEVYLTAYQKFSQLKNKESFKPWLISIARNKCSDYFRKQATRSEISMDAAETEPLYTRMGVFDGNAVQETLELLGDKDREVLYLSFWQELSHSEIAKRLNIPVGTVKSRLHTAKQSFKRKYPYLTEEMKGDHSMKKLPEIIPAYTIEASAAAPFGVKWEELMGWFLVPKPGEQLRWGMYDSISRRCNRIFDMKVTGRAKVHGIEGVELTARETSFLDKKDVVERTFVAQLTDTHCRYLATLRHDGEVRNYITFLDGDEFMPNWGFGEDNCGNATNLAPKGDIHREGAVVTAAEKPFLLDIVGRYTVTINGKTYDTVCVMDIETYNGGVVSEQFLDSNGRTILWRRFERDEGREDREFITVNGTVFTHRCDCITDYIL